MNDDAAVFVDTNVLVYAYDADGGEKHVVARALLTHLWQTRSAHLSTQVLQEFYVTVTCKLPRPLSRQQARLLISVYSRWPVRRIEPADIAAASDLEEHAHISFWDALIIISAQRTGAKRLLTEDLQVGQRFGGIVIENPFARPTE
jgi:predicted nucleic acid-binding protein